MNRLTYEIIAKYIGKKHHVQINFKEGDICPNADIEHNTINLPDTIVEDNAFAALAILMHEAAHLRYTKEIPKDIVADKNPAKERAMFNILNAVEDVRIDRKNFDLLPNVHDFYEKHYEKIMEECKKKKIDFDKIPLPNKVMFNAMTAMKRFNKFKIRDKKADAFNAKHEVQRTMESCVRDLDNRNYKQAREKIDQLMHTFGWDKQPPPVGVATTTEVIVKSGGKKGDQKGKGVGVSGVASQGKPNAKDAQGGDVDALNKLGDDEAFANRQGHGTVKVNAPVLGNVGLRDLTKKRFSELLNIKEIKKIDDGMELNTDNIPAFFTGDLEELFQDEKIVHRKKSKLIIVMDASGSMADQLLDNQSRKSVVGGCVEELVKVLDEICRSEGFEVDYNIACFDGEYHPLKKETWRKNYPRFNGGTNLLNAFEKAQDTILKDPEIDGNKMIVLFTDGEVQNHEITSMKKRILRHNADVRCMVIGVGANLTGHLVKDVVGEYNILSGEYADQILISAVMCMLDGEG